MTGKRVIYFGTDGCLGHYPKGINCTLTSEDHDDFNRLDLLFDRKEVWARTHGLFHYKPRSGHSYTCYGVPWSPDDPRPGSKTIIAVEDATEDELWDALFSSPFVLGQFKRVERKYGKHSFFIDYGNKLKSNHTDNGMKKVQCTDAACDYYEQE